jgi:hypothetical protein
MTKEAGDLEHKRIFDKIVASNPSTVTLSEWLTFISCGDRFAAIWGVAQECNVTMDEIEAAESNSHVIVRAYVTHPGMIDITSTEFHLNEPMPPDDDKDDNVSLEWGD